MASGFVRLDDDSCHHQGRAAQLEEVVRCAHFVQAEDAGKDVAEQFLDIVLRSHILAVIGCHLRGRQGALVHLLVLVQRDRINLHRGRGHHVRRFAFLDEGMERLDINLFVANDVGGDKLASVWIVKGLNGSVFDARVFAYDGLYFLQFDAEAANLDLSVFAAHELDVAVLAVAHNVAGTIDAFAVPFHKGGSRFLGLVQVAQAHLRAGDYQFSRRAPRHLLAEAVQDKQLYVIVRFADRDVRLILVHIVAAHIDGCFGRSVRV